MLPPPATSASVAADGFCSDTITNAHTIKERGREKKDRGLVGDMGRERKKDNMKGNERGIGEKRSRRGGETAEKWEQGRESES